MQPEQRPAGVLEVLDLSLVVGRQLLEADHLLEGLGNVDCARHELASPDGASVLKLDAGGAAALDDDPVDVSARHEAPAVLDEGLHEPAGEAHAATHAD